MIDIHLRPLQRPYRKLRRTLLWHQGSFTLLTHVEKSYRSEVRDLQRSVTRPLTLPLSTEESCWKRRLVVGR
jgi:hypothetical protein